MSCAAPIRSTKHHHRPWAHRPKGFYSESTVTIEEIAEDIGEPDPWWDGFDAQTETLHEALLAIDEMTMKLRKDSEQKNWILAKLGIKEGE